MGEVIHIKSEFAPARALREPPSGCAVRLHLLARTCTYLRLKNFPGRLHWLFVIGERPLRLDESGNGRLGINCAIASLLSHAYADKNGCRRQSCSAKV